MNLSRSVRDGRDEGERMLSSVNKQGFINTLLPGVDGGRGTGVGMGNFTRS